MRAYYALTKPGIIYGNLLTATAGFLLAAHWHIRWGLFMATLGGTALIIAAACVYNNYIDRGIDHKMKRTKQRALVLGAISPKNALVFATILVVLGFSLVIAFTNWLVVLVGAVAFIDYVVLYGIAKRRSVHGTVVGSISGAAPIVAGYVAASGRFDVASLLLFLILVSWQMPHFYAIALYRSQDYATAGIPVLPVKRGLRQTKSQILLYIGLFVIANLLLTALGYTGYIYLAVMTIIGCMWLGRGIRTPYQATTSAAWGKQMFLFSLLVVTVLSVMLAVGAQLA